MSEIVVRDQREPGWFHLDNEIVDQYGARLGAYGISVYAVLCRRCTASQEVRSLSQRDIAATLGISQDRVRKSLADLAELGLIQIDTPDHPAPGVIATIRLLKVKATERHTFSSGLELNATRSAIRNVKSKSSSPPLENIPTEVSSKAFRPIFSQSDFDARDLRKLGEAFREINRRLAASVGCGTSVSEGEFFEAACEWAGISVERGLEVQARGKKWPQAQTMGASA